MSGKTLLSLCQHITYDVAMLMPRISYRDLTHKRREVLTRIAHGERLEVTLNGTPVAVISAPDPEDVVMEQLVAEGQAPADWRERQARLRNRLHQQPALPAEPGKPPLSDVLIAMREQERA